jgi:leucyl aminopeptidase
MSHVQIKVSQGWFMKVIGFSFLVLMISISTVLAHSHSAIQKIFSTSSNPSQKYWVTVDKSLYKKSSFLKEENFLKTQQEFSVAVALQLSEKQIEQLSGAFHEEHHRCGGFIRHESYEEMLAFQKMSLPNKDFSEFNFTEEKDYQINQQAQVYEMLRLVEESKITETILTLSQFNNRFYKAATGVESSKSLAKIWQSLIQNRSDAKVELIQHPKWPQPSVVLTITGSSKPDEIVVLGGHADSISQTWGGTENARAPGADDNASGIATLTEAIRLAVLTGWKPQRTVQFMGYAAEEVGLLGSQEIAQQYKRTQKKVVGKIQFDMTLNKGTPQYDIVLMTDYTSKTQNDFLAKLIDEYVKVPWGYSKCGYGCSDHASWHNAGYPTSMPFESTMSDSNKRIHTKNDTLETAGGNAKHAVNFAKLAVAYMVELAN